MSLQDRLVAVAEALLPVTREDDGALTVHHDGTFASLRVVGVAEGLELVSLNQILAWDLPLDEALRVTVAEHTRGTLLGTVSLAEKDNSTADVLLRYNFPGSGLSDEALGTLIMMVLATGADVRRTLTS
ncbi:hypothetical protein [Mycolicibacterium diernhoferi]|uniref:YbjN domain-containing protein n=1 Tax=Mycolicibacterium diernhoferi TaxID=1801 RepID=A0A1Q4HLY9_9MYCO|nr:hypothetical protein [Mycolicibacterium diernhoferi]OJZ68421.1 hypothetical protein BRW64_02250 [Mycolicibacterium diernhoferi]OPE48686.1 hypothetical protein BV510_23400 [Mycolicibacterium diernhoferi]PEG52051.1 hypothetical protein CRI78_23185 [Mycolicibacterium diernhoferi]QYL21081.1 hypothetical protein K0O62_18790 [Mycolicibacterium diernhoferi]